MQNPNKSFFRKIENKISRFEFKNRTYLSRHKFLYALLGATGVVLYWRGIWHTADYFENTGGIFKILFSPIGSMVLGVVILASIGLLVQEFIGADVIITGLKKERRDIDKSEEELLQEKEKNIKERNTILEIDEHLHKIEKRIDDIDIELDDLK